MEFDGTLNVDIYAHTFNKDINRTDRNVMKETAFAGREWWFGKNLKDITPFFAIDWEAFQGTNFYSFFEAGLQNAYHGDLEIGSTAFNTNIVGFQNFKFNFKLLDVSIPHRAFVSVGGDGWNIEVGRDKVNWGAGQTGNLVISDNFPYYDLFRATTYSEKYKYSYLVTFFPNKVNYYTNIDGNTPLDRGTSGSTTTQSMDGVYLYSAHRFEGRFFKDKLTVSLTEALTYEDSAGQIQFAVLSPMYFMHNAFIPHNSNSTLSIEVDWATPIKGLNVYGQFLSDQGSFIGFEGKKGPGMSSSEDPDALAYLAGINYVTGLGKGILKTNLEAAYVNSYTYLRDSGDSYWGLDYVASIRARMYAYSDITPSGDLANDEFVIGYNYGPDCVTGQIKAEYEYGKFDFSLKAFGMLHGVHDRYTKWRAIPANCSEEEYAADFGSLSVFSGLENYRYNDTAKRTALWTTIDIGTSVCYEVSKMIDVYATFDIVSINNIYNYEGNNALDCQLILGGKINLF